MGHVRGRVARNCRGCARQLTEAVSIYSLPPSLSLSLSPCRCRCVARTETWERARACIHIRSARSSFEAKETPEDTLGDFESFSPKAENYYATILLFLSHLFSRLIEMLPRVTCMCNCVARASTCCASARARDITAISANLSTIPSFSSKMGTISLASGTSR